MMRSFVLATVLFLAAGTTISRARLLQQQVLVYNNQQQGQVVQVQATASGSNGYANAQVMTTTQPSGQVQQTASGQAQQQQQQYYTPSSSDKGQNNDRSNNEYDNRGNNQGQNDDHSNSKYDNRDNNGNNDYRKSNRDYQTDNNSYTSSGNNNNDDSNTRDNPDSTDSGSHSSPSSSTNSGDPINDPELQKTFDMQNSLRLKHQVDALTWSVELQAGAQQWADACVFQHSGPGENLAQYFPNFQAATKGWTDEEKDYKYDGQFSYTTGHFTQILWKATTQIGCGYAVGCQLYVCRYSPAGNVIGQFNENVFPPTQ